MSFFEREIARLRAIQNQASVEVFTLGGFEVRREGTPVTSKDWGRDKTVQLFQFLITARNRRGLHKEQIIDRLWYEELNNGGDQSFKVALHGVNKALEPNRKSRTEARYVIRQGSTYQLNLDEIWIDADALERFIAVGNQALLEAPEMAKAAYREALALYQGIYLPNRLYEDWSSEERERLQVLTLGAMLTLGELILPENPLESIRLAQSALLIDAAWEDAYRLQMQAYLQKGNRPMAIKSYQQCKNVLEKEFGLEPLPETNALLKKIRSL